MRAASERADELVDDGRRRRAGVVDVGLELERVRRRRREDAIVVAHKDVVDHCRRVELVPQRERAGQVARIDRELPAGALADKDPVLLARVIDAVGADEAVGSEPTLPADVLVLGAPHQVRPRSLREQLCARVRA